MPRQKDRCVNVAAVRGRVALGLAISAGGVALLAREAWEGEVTALDQAVIGVVRPALSPALARAAEDVSFFGGDVFLVLLVALAAVLLAMRGARGDAVWLVLTALAGGAAITVLKELIGRPRPNLWHFGPPESSFAFPSGHTGGSIIVYGALAYLLSSAFPRARIAIVCSAAILACAIGLSRVILGVHWPTDVLGATFLGLGWLLLMLTVRAGLKERRL
jgi:undecaprenyl-diphosphatase